MINKLFLRRNDSWFAYLDCCLAVHSALILFGWLIFQLVQELVIWDAKGCARFSKLWLRHSNAEQSRRPSQGIVDRCCLIYYYCWQERACHLDWQIRMIYFRWAFLYTFSSRCRISIFSLTSRTGKSGRRSAYFLAAFSRPEGISVAEWWVW
jgi:hypothetical protein